MLMRNDEFQNAGAPMERAVDSIIQRFGDERENIIPILQAVQEKYRYLPPEALQRIADTTSITPAAITSVATFYSQFRLRPAGRHFIRVCIGTACHVKGAEAIFDAFRKNLNITGDQDTDPDRLFTVEKVACLGCCMLAPAVQIDDVTYGFLEPAKVSEVINDFLSSVDERREIDETAQLRRSASGEVRICRCASCGAGGANVLAGQLRNRILALALPVRVTTVACTGMAYQTPLIEIRMADGLTFHYGRVRPEDVDNILLRHFRPTGLGRRFAVAAGSLFEKLYTDESWAAVTRYAVDVRNGPDACFTGSQVHLVTEQFGHISPDSLHDYLKHDGFKALRKVLFQWDSARTIEEITGSGLRGRGGAGFLSGVKWELVKSAKSPHSIVVANGDEGDPGAFMDRMILESFPFRVIEGLLIACAAVGARTGILYIRDEYPLALDRVRKALAQCAEYGYLGDNILGSGFSCELKTVAGAGAFVCGEETALIASLEGRRGLPRPRPPYPAERGLHGEPTLVNNVETLALVPWIIRNGACSFKKFGSRTSSGTKTFALAGKIARSGLIEVPMGTTLREIVEKIGGGVPDGRRFKAVQIGGPSGGCVPASLAGTKVDFDALTEAGAMMGSGGLVVLDDTDCMVDMARYFMTFTQQESCGKCSFCRVGTRHMLDILERLCAGSGAAADLEQLERLAMMVRSGSQCGLGRTAPNPVLSTLTHFRDEYEAHVQGRCPAGTCRALITFEINGNCIGCTQCARKCPVEAIESLPYRQHRIDPERCIRCGACMKECPKNAVGVV